MSRSSTGSVNSNSQHHYQPQQHHLNNHKENENLEEDMRKAKESADLLKSVVLPLETEIKKLKTKIKDMENYIKNNSIVRIDPSSEIEFYTNLNNDFHSLKDQLTKSFNKFVDTEIKNIFLITEMFLMLNEEQKTRFLSELKPGDFNLDGNESDKNEQFVEFINIVTVPQSLIDEMMQKYEHLHGAFLIQNKNEKTKSDLQQAYENEKTLREDIEKTLKDKGVKTKEQIEKLNKEMSNLESIIGDLRGQYVNWQSQFQIQIDGLVRLNEDIQSEMVKLTRKNEKLKEDNLKLKSEIKVLNGERSMVTQDFEKEFLMPQTTDDLQKLVNAYRADMINLSVSNQILTKRNENLTEKIKALNTHDQLVISQSLESELERERKVRLNHENENNLLKNQLTSMKDKSQQLIDTLRNRNQELNDELQKVKSDQQELNNQMLALKRDMKNSVSVQEDLVKLNQSLQIELEQTKTSEKELRCQHADDFIECSTCKSLFNSTRIKVRCKHCCKIFCPDCCCQIVHSGPNSRPNKVCENCFRILDKDSTNKPVVSSA